VKFGHWGEKMTGSRACGKEFWCAAIVQGKFLCLQSWRKNSEIWPLGEKCHRMRWPSGKIVAAVWKLSHQQKTEEEVTCSCLSCGIDVIDDITDILECRLKKKKDRESSPSLQSLQSLFPSLLLSRCSSSVRP
jgi:hypothetical protein